MADDAHVSRTWLKVAEHACRDARLYCASVAYLVSLPAVFGCVLMSAPVGLTLNLCAEQLVRKSAQAGLIVAKWDNSELSQNAAMAMLIINVCDAVVIGILVGVVASPFLFGQPTSRRKRCTICFVGISVATFVGVLIGLSVAFVHGWKISSWTGAVVSAVCYCVCLIVEFGSCVLSMPEGFCRESAWPVFKLAITANIQFALAGLYVHLHFASGSSVRRGVLVLILLGIRGLSSHVVLHSVCALKHLGHECRSACLPFGFAQSIVIAHVIQLTSEGPEVVVFTSLAMALCEVVKSWGTVLGLTEFELLIRFVNAMRQRAMEVLSCKRGRGQVYPVEYTVNVVPEQVAESGQSSEEANVKQMFMIDMMFASNLQEIVSTCLVATWMIVCKVNLRNARAPPLSTTNILWNAAVSLMGELLADSVTGSVIGYYFPFFVIRTRWSLAGYAPRFTVVFLVLSTACFYIELFKMLCAYPEEGTSRLMSVSPCL
eukprot:TRINITY_DN11571_c0_g1_i3.p1 TRINITY_DN11571_c0_g1~~TRINITY_DN11571_c0_g1_i3.p1  ORF type:complete len:488 (+),score=34.43 TRINITY_DN11571_c0_g1_i3:117-1580(+)